MSDIQTKLCHLAALAASATTKANDELDRLQARCAALEEALHSARPYVAHAYECSFPDEEVNASVLRDINAVLFPADAPAEGANNV